MPNILITVPHSGCSQPDEPDRTMHNCDYFAPIAAHAFVTAAEELQIGQIELMLAEEPREAVDLNSEAAFDSPWRKRLRNKMLKHSNDTVLLDVHTFPVRKGSTQPDVKLIAVGTFPGLLGDLLAELGDRWSIGVHSLGMSEAKKENIIFEAAMKQMPALGIKFNEGSFDEPEYQIFAEIFLRHLGSGAGRPEIEESDGSSSPESLEISENSYGSADSSESSPDESE